MVDQDIKRLEIKYQPSEMSNAPFLTMLEANAVCDLLYFTCTWANVTTQRAVHTKELQAADRSGRCRSRLANRNDNCKTLQNLLTSALFPSTQTHPGSGAQTCIHKQPTHLKAKFKQTGMFYCSCLTSWNEIISEYRSIRHTQEHAGFTWHTHTHTQSKRERESCN